MKKTVYLCKKYSKIKSIDKIRRSCKPYRMLVCNHKIRIIGYSRICVKREKWIGNRITANILRNKNNSDVRFCSSRKESSIERYKERLSKFKMKNRHYFVEINF